MIPTPVIQSVRPASAASRVRDLLKSRDRAEVEIAAILRQQLDQLGEKKWLEWCEKEFGWARTSAYRHLNPLGSQKARDDQKARDGAPKSAMSQALGHNEEETAEDDGPEEEAPTQDHLNALLLRADQAISFATNCARLNIRPRHRAKAIEMARSAATAWTTLADKLENQ